MKAKELRQLIEMVCEKGFSEFEIEKKGFRLRLSRFPDPRTGETHVSQPVIVASPIPVPLELSAGTGSYSEAARPAQTRPVVEERPSPPRTAPAPREEDLHIIKSPIVGTFYGAPSPNAEPFVDTGDHVEQDTVVCIIEAMKLMNEIQAEVVGEVVACYVESGQPVEYGQKLFAIRA